MATKNKDRAFAPDANFGAILEWMARYASYETLAERMGVSRSTLWRYKEGTMKPRAGKRTTMMQMAVGYAQTHGDIPDDVRAEFEKAGVLVKDRVAQVLYV